MSEQKFYKMIPKDIYNEKEMRTIATYHEATPEDFEKAGWVKREKIEPERNYDDTFSPGWYCACETRANVSIDKYCRCCGSELIWKK